MIIKNESMTVDWDIRAGTTYKAVFTLIHPETNETFDLTDIVLDGDARVETNTSELFAMPILKRNQITNRGEFEINLSHEFTTSLALPDKPRVFKYDIRMKYPNDEIYVPIMGKMNVSEIITKDGND